MKVRQLTMKNFRSVAEGTLLFSDHTLLLGGNSVGKSTVCEALDLLLGPERLRRTSSVDEHDFHERRYLDGEGNPIPIELEVVLTDLTDDLVLRYRNHVEYWDEEEEALLGETDQPEDADSATTLPALRIAFRAAYDPEEDEFVAETYFVSPPSEDGDRLTRVSSADKRSFGFIYLRALRTGTRALSLERGSLLDIIIRLQDSDRSKMWESTLHALETLDPPIHEIPQLQSVLHSIDNRIRQFVGLSASEPALGLFSSALTRESLRRTITLFGASKHSEVLVPYWRLGSGVVNAMVFSLLTFIGELKHNVIFAMEEPELAIPPHTQRRIVQFMRNSVDQAILTSHSPFIVEQFSPEQVLVLSRSSGKTLSGRRLHISGIKAKTFRGGIRRHFAEAMLGRGVLCVEGVSDSDVLVSASQVLERDGVEDHAYTPLDLSGVTIVQCDGDGGLPQHGDFFGGLDLKTYAFHDEPTDGDASSIQEAFDRSWQLEYRGIEKLLAEEIPETVLRRFLESASDRPDYPRGERYQYTDEDDGSTVRKTCFEVLRKRKGFAYAGSLIEECTAADIPQAIVEVLVAISEDLPGLSALAGEPDDVEASADDE